jgi:hypothetical protein
MIQSFNYLFKKIINLKNLFSVLFDHNLQTFHGEFTILKQGLYFYLFQDLNSSFSKLPPIIRGKKVKAGKGQAFIVD